MSVETSGTNYVHESLDERQYIRTVLPARLKIKRNGVECEYQIKDLSIGGVGIVTDDYFDNSYLGKAVIEFEFEAMKIQVDVVVKILMSYGSSVGAEFVEMSTEKRNMVRYLISTFLSGELVDTNGVISVLQKESYVKQRNNSKSFVRSGKDRFKSVFGTLVFFSVALGIMAVLGVKLLTYLFTAKSVQAVVNADEYIIKMPENGYVNFIVDDKVKKVRVGQPIATVSTQLMARFNTPSDYEVLSRLTQDDMQLLMGRSMVETTINSPCDCDITTFKYSNTRYAYKEEELIHLLPDNQELNIESSFSFLDFDKLKAGNEVVFHIHGNAEEMTGSIISSSVDKINEQVKITIKPDRKIDKSLYGNPVTVRVMKYKWMKDFLLET